MEVSSTLAIGARDFRATFLTGGPETRKGGTGRPTSDPCRSLGAGPTTLRSPYRKLAGCDDKLSGDLPGSRH